MSKKSQMAHKPRLAVERVGRRVILEIECADDYAAMKFYDEICEGGRCGPYLRIDIEIKNGS